MNAIRLSFVLLILSWAESSAVKRHNILWFVVDDMSANFSCYGEKLIETPNVDRMARNGVLFTQAYATSPVCSTFRSALITGMYQNSIGAHHHRSGRGEHRVRLPDGVSPIPELFQKAGYFTCIGSGLKGYDFRSLPTTTQKRGKTDYNFDWRSNMYDSHDWSGRKNDQPFFMQVQLHGGKLRGASESGYLALESRVKEQFAMEPTRHEEIVLPTYYPRDSVLLRDWANYLDTVRITDWHVGQVMNRLKKEKLLDHTLVVFFTDHGISHARGKQFLYDEGTHIPLIIRGPGIRKGSVRNDLVEHIDVAALSLAAANIQIPVGMDGTNVLDSNHQEKKVVFAARDRCGEAADQIRSVRTKDFLYIKNYFPNRPHMMPSNYKDSKLIISRLREMNTERNAVCNKLLFSPTRPKEELYLYNEDKWQINNLANDKKYAGTLNEMRKDLEQWIIRTGDPGPETMEVYRLEIEDQLKTIRNDASRSNYFNNSKLYLRWFEEGK